MSASSNPEPLPENPTFSDTETVERSPRDPSTLDDDAPVDALPPEPEQLEGARTEFTILPDSLQTVDPNRYEIGKVLARGGQGVVRVAEDRRTGRTVALKELHTPSSHQLRRFEREARITAQLEHPSIVPVHEVGKWPDGSPFFAMKLVGGRPLDVVADEALDPEARLALVPRILPAVDAIAYAHERGMIHRDLKPANVLLGEFGETIVIDWGLAKQLGAEDEEDGWEDGPDTVGQRILAGREGGKLTADGAVLGTPSYMPPEQAAGERLDARADVYSLGALLYHALSGHAPFDGDLRTVLAQLLTEPPEPLAVRAPATPPDLVSIVEKAMAKDRRDRYRDAGELARDLDAFLRGRLVAAYEYTSWELLTRFVRRNRALSAALGSLVVIAAVAVAFVVREQQVGERERERAVAAELRARAQEREAHERLSRAHWQNAVRRLQRGDHLGAELLAAAAMVESPEHPRGPHRTLDADGAEALSRLAGPAATWSAARALRYATRGRAFLDHEDWIYDVLVSDDEQWLVTTSADARAVIWDLETGRVHRALEGHEGTVFQAALDADGARLATSAYDGTIRIWSFPDGELLRSIEHPADRVYGVCFAADGTLLGAGGDGWIAVLDADTGALIRSIEATTFIPWRLRCPRARPVAVLGTVATETVVVDLASAAVLHRFASGQISSQGPEARMRAVGVVDGGAEVIVADEHGGVWRFDGASGALLAHAQLDSVYEALAVSPDGRWVALGSDEISIVDAETLRVVARLDGHAAGVVALTFDPSGSRLFSGSDDHRVLEWVIPATRDGSVLTAPSRSRLDVTAESPDGRWLVAAGDDASVYLWDRDDAYALRALDGHTAPVRAAVFLDAETVATAGMDRSLRIHDLGGGTSERVDLPHFGDELALSPDGSTLAIASGDGAILLRDASDGSIRTVRDAHDARAWWVDFDLSGERLASTDFDGRVALIDVSEARVIRQWEAHEARIYDAGWRPGTEELTTVDLEGWLRVWDPSDGHRVREWHLGEGERGRSVAWSPDGDRVLVTTDRGVRVYDPEGALEARLELPDRTTAGRWTADGRVVFASMGHVYVLPLDLDAWREDPARLLAEAEQNGGTTLDAIMDRPSAR